MCAPLSWKHLVEKVLGSERERERESEGERFMGQGGGVLLPCHVASVQEGESESCSVMSDSL